MGSQETLNLIPRLTQPYLHVPSGKHALVEGHLLLLLAAHGGYLQIGRKVERLDGFEALAQVRLHSQRILGLGEDLKQLIVRQEEEPGREKGGAGSHV